jgi:hypothetical protein
VPREKTASASAIMAATRVGGQTTGVAGAAIIFAAFSISLNVQAVGALAHAHNAISAALFIASSIAFAGAIASSVRFGFPRAKFRVTAG